MENRVKFYGIAKLNFTSKGKLLAITKEKDFNDKNITNTYVIPLSNYEQFISDLKIVNDDNVYAAINGNIESERTTGNHIKNKYVLNDMILFQSKFPQNNYRIRFYGNMFIGFESIKVKDNYIIQKIYSNDNNGYYQKIFPSDVKYTEYKKYDSELFFITGSIISKTFTLNDVKTINTENMFSKCIVLYNGKSMNSIDSRFVKNESTASDETNNKDINNTVEKTTETTTDNNVSETTEDYDDFII